MASNQGRPAPDPKRGVFRWSFRQAGRHWVTSGVVGALLFAAFAAIADSHIPSSWGTRLEATLMALAMSAVGLIGVGVIYALVAAPYEQRNRLRNLFDVEKELHRRTREALKIEREQPVTTEHRDSLRRVAQSVFNDVMRNEKCSYQDSQAHHPGNSAFRTSIRTHCPEVCAPFDAWDNAIDNEHAARIEVMAAVKERVLTSGSFENPPWLPDQIAVIVGSWVQNCVDVPSTPPFLLQLRHLQPTPGPLSPEDLLTSNWGNLPVRTIEGLKDHDDVEAIQREVMEFAQPLRDIPETDVLRARTGDARIAQRAAQEAAQSVMVRLSIPRGDGCGLC